MGLALMILFGAVVVAVLSQEYHIHKYHHRPRGRTPEAGSWEVEDV